MIRYMSYWFETISKEKSKGAILSKRSYVAEYEAALRRIGCSRGTNVRFVAGHCFMSSCAASSPCLRGDLPTHGARRVRLAISRAYRNSKWFGSYASGAHASKQPLGDGFPKPEPGAKVSTVDKWLFSYFEERSHSMSSIDVEATTDSLWEYNNLTDFAATVNLMCLHFVFQLYHNCCKQVAGTLRSLVVASLDALVMLQQYPI